MVLDFGFGEPVEHLRYRPQGVSADGFKIPASFDAVTLKNVGVDIAVTSEPSDGTVQRADVDLVLFLPAGTRCDSKDRFKVRGKEYTVVGVGEPLPNFFTGAVFRTEVKVKRFNG